MAYRAGGYGLQPHARAVLKALEETGYLIEASVVPGMRRMTGRYRVDFTSVPARGNWIIGSEGGLDRESASGLLEVPIPSGTIGLRPFIWQLATYLNRRIGPKQDFLDGSGHSFDADRGRAVQVGSVGESWSRKFRILTSRWSRLAIPAAPIPTLKNLTDNWIRDTRGRRRRLLDASALQGPDAKHARRRADLYALGTISLCRASGILDFPGARTALGGRGAVEPRRRLWRQPAAPMKDRRTALNQTDSTAFERSDREAPPLQSVAIPPRQGSA